MIVLQLLLLFTILIIVPWMAGGFFVTCERRLESVLFRWVSGQVLLWAVFQVICVPFVLLEKSFRQVVYLFSAVTVFFVIFGILVDLYRHRRVFRANMSVRKKGHTEKEQIEKEQIEKKQTDRRQCVLWGIFGIFLLMQLILAVFLAYEEGDDAYYVAISTITEDSELMYMKQAYTGGGTTLDARHGLAPLPIWVAYLARVTSIPSVTVAQILLPLVLIVMSYGIYLLVGTALLEKHRKWLPVFMIFIALMVLFGGYSTYSAENFLLVRTAQGKAVIANIVIPFMIYLLFRMLQALEKGEAILKKYWLLMALTMIVGCLCSTLGSLLTCILLGIVGCCAVVCYRKWKLLMPMAACCVVPVMFALLYLVLE